jgi:hypothetical protein
MHNNITICHGDAAIFLDQSEKKTKNRELLNEAILKQTTLSFIWKLTFHQSLQTRLVVINHKINKPKLVVITK